MSGGRPGQEVYDPQDSRLAYLLDSTLSELALSSQQSGTATAWTWLTTPGGGDDLATPPPLPEGTIPNVKLEHFRKYMASVGVHLEKFQHIIDHGVNEAQQGQLLDATPRDKAPTGLAQALVEVPLQYFREDFTLDWDLLGAIDSPEKQQVVVEELSSQLDRIETHLTSEIAGRYSSFFEASIYIQELQEDVQQLVGEIVTKRKDMESVVAEAQEGTETAITLRRRKQNLLKTLDLAMALQQVVHAKAAMQSSLEAASYAGLDYIGALEVLEQLEGTCHGDVMNLAAVGKLPEYMDGVQNEMKGIMITDLVERTTMGIDACVGAVLSGDVGNEKIHPGASSINGSIAGESGQGLAGVAPLVLSLCRIHRLSEGVKAVQKSLHQDMTNLLTALIRDYLVRSISLDAEDAPADLEPGPLAVALYRANSEQYLELLHLCVEVSKSFFAHSDGVISSLSSALPRPPRLPSDVLEQYTLQINECSHRAVQEAVTCWGHLLASWTTVADANKLGLNELRRILDITDAFASLAETHMGKSVATLQAPIQQSCKAALDLMHAANITQLNSSLERERWVYATLSDRALDGIKELGGASGPPGDNGTAPVTVVVGSHSFRLVETAQVLLGLLQQSIEFSEAVPAFVADVSQRVVELLRSFNSKTCQLILGAGAMQVSGLKSITVKHLAVACHTIRLVLALFPCLTAKFVDPISLPRRTLIAKEFLRTSQDMTVHCSEINNKIITIMCERVTPMNDFVRILAASVGIGTAARDAPLPSGMAVNTMKQLQILCDILTTTALVEDKETIMQQVLRNFVSVLTASYDDTQLEAAGLQEQASSDLQYLLQTIHSLPLDEKILEGCTRDMTALHLRKVSGIEAHKQAQEAAAVEVVEEGANEDPEEASADATAPQPPLPVADPTAPAE